MRSATDAAGKVSAVSALRIKSYSLSMPAATTPTSATCPCCGRQVVLAQQENLKTRDNKVWPAVASLAAHGKYFEHHNKQERLAMYWACNQCLRERRAIRA